MRDINRDGDKLYADLQQKHFGPEDNYIAYCYSKIFKIIFFVLEYEKSYVVFLKT